MQGTTVQKFVRLMHSGFAVAADGQTLLAIQSNTH